MAAVGPRAIVHAPLLFNSIIISRLTKHGSSVIWKGKDARCFSCRAQAMRYSDTGPTHQLSSSSIPNRFVTCKSLPSSSQPVDIKVACGAFIELRELFCPPPQRSVVLGLRRCSFLPSKRHSYTGSTREPVRWSIRLWRALRQLW